MIVAHFRNCVKKYRGWRQNSEFVPIYASFVLPFIPDTFPVSLSFLIPLNTMNGGNFWRLVSAARQTVIRALWWPVYFMGTHCLRRTHPKLSLRACQTRGVSSIAPMREIIKIDMFHNHGSREQLKVYQFRDHFAGYRLRMHCPLPQWNSMSFHESPEPSLTRLECCHCWL